MPSSQQDKRKPITGVSKNQDDIHEQKQNQSIFQSPFIGTNRSLKNSFSASTPLLLPQQSKRTSPVKKASRKVVNSSIDLNKVHSRNRTPLNFSNGFNRSFSLLDDFQNGNLDETIDLFPAPALNPPQNSKPNNFDTASCIHKDDGQENNINRNFFEFGNTSSEGNFSIFSMIPTTGDSSPAFDFNSYLLSVTSNLQMIPKIPSKGMQHTNLLDLSKPLKLDILQEKDRSVISKNNIMDDLELDCVVRSSVWDSDTETEDELDLHLNLDNEKDVEAGKNEPSDNAIDDSLRNDYDVTSDDYLRYFNQSMTSKPSDRTPSYNQAPGLVERSQSFASPRFTISNDITSMSKPVQIYSDPQPKLKSPISSQGSDETLHEDEEHPTISKISSSNTNHQKRTINFSLEHDHQLDTDLLLKKQTVDTRKCSPHHHLFTENLRSALKPIPKALLNLIVESSDGSLEDATRYATEINAQNSEGIPIPEKTTELVNIPTTAPSINGIRKSAIVRGVRARTGNKKKMKRQLGEKLETSSNDIENRESDNYRHVDKLVERRGFIIQENENRQNIISNINNTFRGFYSLQEKQQFSKRNAKGFPDSHLDEEDKENIDSEVAKKTASYRTTSNMTGGFKRAKVMRSDYTVIDNNGKKRVNWAENLEW